MKLMCILYGVEPDHSKNVIPAVRQQAFAILFFNDELCGIKSQTAATVVTAS